MPHVTADYLPIKLHADVKPSRYFYIRKQRILTRIKISPVLKPAMIEVMNGLTCRNTKTGTQSPHMPTTFGPP